MGNVEKLRELNKQSYAALEMDFDATRFKPWREMEPISKLIHDGTKILDLGCGNARLLKALPPVNFMYTGIDGNEYLLKKAKEHNPQHEFRVGDLETIILPKNSYDFIFMIASFHHLVTDEDRIELLRKCREALTRDGSLIISVWRLWQFKYLVFLFTRRDLKLDWNDFFIPWKKKDGTIWRYYHGFTEHELDQLLRKAGFSTKFLRSSKDGQLVRRGYNIFVQSKKYYGHI